jgi:tripartite-type tricarboxylate transporter receptor subunit TctC
MDRDSPRCLSEVVCIRLFPAFWQDSPGVDRHLPPAVSTAPEVADCKARLDFLPDHSPGCTPEPLMGDNGFDYALLRTSRNWPSYMKPGVENFFFKSKGSAMMTAALKSNVARTLFAAAGILLLTGTTYGQTDFPNRRIHVVLPYPAGGIVDIVTRIVTDKLTEVWRQPIVVEAKPGANGNLAWDQVSRAVPDGYTWTFVGPALMANPRLYANLRYSEKNFVPVGAAAWAPAVFVVHPGLPVNTMAEFIAHVRKNPGALNWASPGLGTSQHLNTAIFINATKLNMTVVPYGGQPAGIIDLMANRVQFMVASIGLVAQHIDSAAVKPLAVLGIARSPLLPAVPTVSEAGYPEINVVPWYGYVVPRATPQAVVDKIVAAFGETLKVPKVRDTLGRQAVQPMEPMTASELAELYGADTEKYAKVIREAGLKISD